MEIIKNRQRDLPDFANINLLGKCNADCYFCLGKDIQSELHGKNQLNVHFSQWKNFDEFLSLCKENEIKKLYLTGQTADGLQYNYLEEIVDFLQDNGFEVGVRTNGLLLEKKIDAVRKMKGEIGLSIHSLDEEANQTIMKAPVLNWDKLIPMCGENTRISIVVNRYNINEFGRLVKYLSGFNNVKYIQARRISTDTREDLLIKDVELYEDMLTYIRESYDLVKYFHGAEIYNMFGKEICFWATVETSANSFNYFTDGTISDEYFIVEGYLKHMEG